MRKIAGYLLLFYFILIIGLVLYNHLAPPPPPKPPSAWELTWRERGSIVALTTIAMLSMIELAIGIFIMGGVLVLLKKGWTIWANSVGRSGGLAPVLRERDGWYDPNPDGAVLAAAIAAHAPKVTASMAGHMMGAALGRGKWSVQDTTYTDAPPVLDAPYQVVEEFRPEMVNATGFDAQHHIFVGPTGSGKSVAAFSILDEMRRQQPHATFLIFEPGRVEWKSQAVTGDFDDLFMLVKQLHEEMRRRQQMLAAHPTAKHAFELGLPPIVLFIEEAGSALDYYKLSPEGVKKAKEFTLYLRNLLREARKTGISVVLVDQAAMAETIPTQVLDNVPHVWIMVKGASPKLLRRWGLTDRFRKLKEAGLLKQQPGLSFDYHADRLVQFPLRERPLLMEKAPDVEAVLARTRQGASGVRAGKSDGTRGSQSGISAVRTGVQPQKKQNSGHSAGNSDSAVRTGTSSSQAARVIRFDPEEYVRVIAAKNEKEGRDAAISYNSARLIYRLYQQHRAIKTLQRRLWPDVSTGGYRFYWLRDIIEQMEDRPRSRPTVTVIFPEKKHSSNASH